MNKHFYRFRSGEALLDKFQELEKQEIYFASASELNDPMEGFRDVIWEGDQIAWRNLFGHYLRCLTHACTLLLIGGEEYSLDWEQIPIFDPRKPTEGLPVSRLSEQIDAAFFSAEADKYLDALASRTVPLRRDELHMHIRHLHPLAISTILSCFATAGLVPASMNHELPLPLRRPFEACTELVNYAEKILPSPEKREDALIAFFAAVRQSGSQLSFVSHYNNEIDAALHNKNFVLMRFPDEYVDKLDALLYPDWYTACFMSDCRNAALWAYYGDNHYGACLQFRTGTDSSHPSIPLERATSISSSGVGREFTPHQFFPVTYTDSHIRVDFFRSIGRLTILTLKKNWYFNEQGERSRCAAAVFDQEDLWRENYWAAFQRSATTKLRDWESEQEHRLLLHCTILDFSDRSERKLKYDFDSLSGIIFGMKMHLDEKTRICRIIEAKCRATNRTDFKFYQAYYSPLKGTIEHTELSLLKFGA